LSLLKSFSIEGKVALITGASRGIGQAIAEAYAAAGAKVVLSSRKQKALETVAGNIRAAGGEALPVAAHTGDMDGIQEMVSEVLDAYGGIDILVNNAGTNPHYGPVLESEESQWSKTFDVNVMGYYRMVKACCPVMRDRGGGKIINVASVAGKRPQPGMGIYCVTKAGVLMLTEVLAVELAEYNIQVNAIGPGFIKTRFSRAIWDNSKLLDRVTELVPQKRIATSDELVGIALYLATDLSSFTTGATIIIDGGQLVASGI
jgi:NAD(P)-dependent dehydrogenase (short-subunit alcohol dehydrogenase family)